MSDLNIFGDNARLPGGPNDKNPTARHESGKPSGAEPEKDLTVKSTTAEDVAKDAPKK